MHMYICKTELQDTQSKNWQNWIGTDNSTLVFADFNTLLSIVQRISREKVKKDIKDEK